MSADSNIGFHHDTILASVLNRHSISFQSEAINSTSEIISGCDSVGVNSTGGIILAGDSSMINNNNHHHHHHHHHHPGMINSAGGLLLNSVPGLNHDTGSAVEWSIEEQSKLEQGLVKYTGEPNIMKYIKIAATLRNKTVRDVALRCRWMTKKENGKRRKPEGQYMGKKMKDRKEKLVESSSKPSIPLAPLLNMATYSLMMHHMDHKDRMLCEAIGVTTRHLLDENAQVFCQITTNLATYKIQDNIDLFCRTRNNITAILNNMRDMPGIMSQMPPLPVSINEELFYLIQLRQ